MYQYSEKEHKTSHESTTGLVLTDIAAMLDKINPILIELTDNEDIVRPQVRTAVEYLEKELTRAKELIASAKLTIKQVEDMAQELGRSLGLVLFASIDVSAEIKDRIAGLHREFMSVKFVGGSLRLSSYPSVNPSPRPSLESGFVSEVDSDKEIEEENVVLSVEDAALQLKYGDDEQFEHALLILDDSMRDGLVDNEWIDDERIVQVLLNRLSTRRCRNRLIVIRTLRNLALRQEKNKEKMADVGSISAIVKCLTGNAAERREAVGLLFELSDITAIRRRLGRIQGCIVMLVSMLNGDDETASHNAQKLLIALSNNTQNAIYMAEAGYFKPLVKYLMEGSDMSKILMAKTISRMELTDQSRVSLGEDGAIEPLVNMFKTGKLEAKFSALNALQNLSNLKENIPRLVSSGIVAPLLQLLFAVTSVLMTLWEPAAAILAKIAQLESILVNQDVVQQMLSLLNLSSPVIQFHLLQALNSIASHSSSSKVQKNMTENGAVNLLLPFLCKTNFKIRTAALCLLHTLSNSFTEELTLQLGESHITTIVNFVCTSASDIEKAAAIGILSNLPISNKKITDILKKTNLLSVITSMVNSNTSTTLPASSSLEEGIASILIRFTVPSDKKLQHLSAELGVIPLLVKFLSTGSLLVKSRAAFSLSQLSQNTLALRKSKKLRWACMPPTAETVCEVHDSHCTVKSTFCMVKAGAISPLIQILEGTEREPDEAVLSTLATLLEEEIWESGSNYIAKKGGIQAIIRVMASGNVKAQEKALWILERIFRIEEHKVQYAPSAQVKLIDLAQNGDPRLRPTVAKVLAQLELIQDHSSYF